ncbi:MAG: efflux RND transporter periplasmic adaptor subunit [Paludibacteraceae bacterium]|nr:efflux RND transporter periplasmic adaptor subunit [Paludibacteraceae bacterium]
MKEIFFSMITLSLLIVSCKNEVKPTEEEHESHEENVVELTDQQLNTIGIKLGRVEQRQLSGTINATGTLKLSPQDRAEVTSLVAGITKRILVKEGQNVRQGESVALVENTEIVALQKDYLVASRQLTLAQQALQRQQDIHAQGAGVEKNLQQAKAELDIARVTEKGLRLQLKQLGISSSEVAQGNFSNTAPVRSPITGVVGEILVSTGSHLDSETVLMKVYDNKALHADLHVFESDIAGVHIGQKVSMQLPDHSSTLLTGVVSFVTAALDNESKSASVHVKLDQVGGAKLLPNMFVSAVIHCNEQTCDAVPDEAIVMRANRKFVFVSLGSNRFRKQEVVTGFSQQGYTQITFTDSVPPSTEIVTAKAFYLESMLADHGEEE